MVKAMDCGIVYKRVRIPVALLRSLSDKYLWERYEPPYPPSYGLNSTTTVLQGEWSLALNNRQRLICHKKTKKPNQSICQIYQRDARETVIFKIR